MASFSGMTGAVCVQGCIELLDRSGVEISGKRAVVIGRSNIVGMPVAMLLTNRDATVTIVHSRTQNAQEICSTADIVIAAVGKPEVVKGDWIKPGAAVIDVGTNAVDVSFSDPYFQSSPLKNRCCKPIQSNLLNEALLVFVESLQDRHSAMGKLCNNLQQLMGCRKYSELGRRCMLSIPKTQPAAQ